ncbi:hypothetical protein KBC99_03375, partial [Candidatus Saccharibacteria bacterium]|nr:hypothetical protein [Candidatus Saccharibacteria bacterium]
MTKDSTPTLDPSLKPLTPGQIISEQRRTLFGIGLFFLIVALATFRAPFLLLKPALWLIGIGFGFSALLKASQLSLGRHRSGLNLKSAVTIIIQMIIDIFLCVIFLSNNLFSYQAIAFLLGIFFFIDGGLQLIIAWRSPSIKGRTLYLINGLFTMLLGGLTFFFAVGAHIPWIAILVAIRFLSYGLVLITMALNGRQPKSPIIFTAMDTSVYKRIPGQIYACYFGGAFHVGIYVGNDMVVHFRQDNYVHYTSWDVFLQGREPLRWEYPDVEPAPPKQIVAYAKKMAKKRILYNMFTYNCEHFV